MITKLKSLKENQGFMKYFKNTSWLFGEKILRMIVGLFVGIWVARYLGPEQFGLFSYAQSFVALFSAVATLGLDGIVVRELVKDGSRADELIGTAFWLKLMGAIVVLLLLAIAVNFTSNDTLTNSLIFIIASATIFQSFNVVDMFFQAKVMSKYVVFANVISLLFSSVVKIYLILIEAPLLWFAWSVLFDSFVLACGFLYFYFKNNLSIKKWKYDRKIAIALLKDSWPLMIAGMSFVIFSNIDNIMLKELLNDEAVGIYNAAYRLVTIWYFLPGLLLGSLMPAMVNAHVNKELFYKRIRYVSSLLLWIGILISISYMAFSNYIIDITYGSEYYESANLLMVLAWVNILIFFNSSWNKWMEVENKTKRTLIFHVITAFFNIILNLFFIKLYGAVGATYALLLALLMTYIIYFFYYKEMFYMFLLSISFGKIKVVIV